MTGRRKVSMIENNVIIARHELIVFRWYRALAHSFGSSARGVTAGKRIIDRSRARDPGMNIVNIPATSVHTRRYILALYRGSFLKKFGNHCAIVAIYILIASFELIFD